MEYPTHKQRLLNILREKSVLRTTPDKPFKLVSGKTSLVYVDVRLTALDAVGLWAIVRSLCGELASLEDPPDSLQVDSVAGVVVGGCPLATGVSLHYSTGLRVINTLYVRKEAKDHGTAKLIEGSYKPGDRVVLLEDVVTSGGSTLGAIKALREAGLVVLAVVAVLDREEGGRAKIEEAGVAFRALVTLRELLENG
jgi:orotate phosphoribosyltransferase